MEKKEEKEIKEENSDENSTEMQFWDLYQLLS